VVRHLKGEPMNQSFHITLPWDLTRDDLVVDPRDVANARLLKDELQWLVDNVRDDEECDRILRLALMTHSRAQRPLNECLRQAVIWERG